MESRGRKVVSYALCNLSSFLSWWTRGEQRFLFTNSAYDCSPVANVSSPEFIDAVTHESALQAYRVSKTVLFSQ